MMTIDDMLSQVAQIVGAAPKNQPDTKPQLSEPMPVHNELKIDPEAAAHSEAALGNILSMRPALGLKTAKEIIYCIERGAEMMGVNAVIAVADGGGKLIALEAMDDSLIASVRAAQDKAYTAAALKMPTHKALEESRGGALDGYTNGSGILMLGGGYPLEFNGYVIGGIGVSGGTKDQDIALAKTGVMYFEKRTESLK
ncbi:MAG: heme-binding protein [Candidatus Ornithomonoglobus sp.]